MSRKWKARKAIEKKVAKLLEEAKSLAATAAWMMNVNHIVEKEIGKKGSEQS